MVHADASGAPRDHLFRDQRDRGAHRTARDPRPTRYPCHSEPLIPDMQLEGKVALITGGRRIGHVVAAQLAAHGADIALSYARSRDEAEQTARSVRASGRRAEIIRADLAQAADCQAFVDSAADALGRIDILLNMASVYVAHAFDDLTAADWD